jgi:isopenicillin N synthase-like dioxygenase
LLLMNAFPIFHLSSFEQAQEAERRQLAMELDRICRISGFLAVTGHGIAQTTIDNAWNAARAFFDLPAAEKAKITPPYPGYPYGYLGPGVEALAKSKGVDSPPDLKESFNSGPLAAPDDMSDPDALSFCYAPSLWPARPDGFRPAWDAYFTAMTDLAARIMQAFAVALDLPADYFDASIGKPISALRALNYPELDHAPPPGQLRAGAHTDYGSLTILLPEQGSRGLEIWTPEGTWAEVPPIEGAFVINIGDLMAQWTNDRWVSTLHRVVNPPPEHGGLKRRQSIAFFHQPDWFAQIRPLDTCVPHGEAPHYPATLSGPWLMNKFRKTVV